MNQFSVMNLRENQILAGASMGYVVGGKKKTQHTGDATTCPHCGPNLPGTDMAIMGTIITGIVMAKCWLEKNFPKQESFIFGDAMS